MPEHHHNHQKDDPASAATTTPAGATCLYAAAIGTPSNATRPYATSGTSLQYSFSTAYTALEYPACQYAFRSQRWDRGEIVDP